MPHKHTTGYWVNSLFVHLFHILNEAPEGNFVCRFDLTHIGEQPKTPTLFDHSRQLSVDTRFESGLVPVVELARLIQELGDHACVPPVNIVLLNTTHKPLADLRSRKRSVDEGRWLFQFKCCLALLTGDNLIASVVSFGPQ